MNSPDLYLLGILENTYSPTQLVVAQQKWRARLAGGSTELDLSERFPFLQTETLLSIKTLLEADVPLPHTLEGLPSDIASALACGKVRIDYCVDTQGGYLSTFHRLQDHLLDLPSGFQLNTYGMDRVMSTGAMAWGLGHKRYACQSSQFMWHLPQGGDTRAKKRWEETTRHDVLDSLRRSHSPQALNYIRQAEALTGTQELRLTGADLYEAGLVDQLFSDPQALKAFISSQTPWRFDR